jgi:hypothetical protein
LPRLAANRRFNGGNLPIVRTAAPDRKRAASLPRARGRLGADQAARHEQIE